MAGHSYKARIDPAGPGDLDGSTVPFGQGDVPIVEALQLMKRNHWKFQATIEFEYSVPQGSDLLIEMGKCVEYCKKALT